VSIPDCPHRPPCPGCPRYGERGLAEGPRRALAHLAARHGCPLDPLEEGPPTGFRTRARLAVRGRAASPKIGLFQAGSHRIVDIPRCTIHHPAIHATGAAAKAAIRAEGVAPYAERPHAGTLRYLQIALDAEARAQLVLVGREATPEPLAPLARRLADGLGPALHSLWWNGQPERSNAILGPHWHRFQGPEALVETLLDVPVFHPPGAFRQSHGTLAARLVELAAEWLPEPGRTVEYFAGCGAIGLRLAGRTPALALNERAPDSLLGLRLGLDALPPEHRERVRVLPGDAAHHLDALERADTVVLDPPRRGAGPTLVAAIAASGVRRVLYVSCGLASFLEEAAALAAGGLALTRLRPLDFFPYSEHVETAALFERA